MRPDAGEKFLAVSFALPFTNAFDMQEIVQGLGKLTAHVAQRRVGKNDVGRHLVAYGKLFSERPELIEKRQVDRLLLLLFGEFLQNLFFAAQNVVGGR